MAKPKGAAVHPEDVTGEWNIRVKKGENDSSTINVNLTNIQAYLQAQTTISKISNKINYAAKSTGVFEKLIADNVK